MYPEIPRTKLKRRGTQLNELNQILPQYPGLIIDLETFHMLR